MEANIRTILRFLSQIYTNDLVKADRNEVLETINKNAIFSFSFISLLITSSLVCTLGLLLNSAPVVIGGMIISPLMWPLLKTALGISYEQPRYIRQAILLLVLSVLITFITSSFITFLSPIKFVTSQILARTSPTLLDLGVAIATSLMPPLCVSGIGLALLDYPTFTGGLLLFITNAVAIIFVAVIVFFFLGVKRKTKGSIRRKGAAILLGIIVIIAIPLYYYLNMYSFKLTAYQKTKDVLQSSFSEISSSIIVNNVTTDFSSSSNDILSVEAQILLPEDISISYTEQQKLVSALENSLNKKVNLQLTIQRRISILTEKDVHFSQIKQKIQKVFSEDIKNMNPKLSIDSLLVDKIGENWGVDAVLRGDPASIITEDDRKTIQEHIKSVTKERILLNIQMIPLVELRSTESVINEKISNEVKSYIIENTDPDLALLPQVDVIKNDNKENILEINVSISAPSSYEPPEMLFSDLKKNLEKEYQKKCTIHLALVDENMRVF